MSPGKRCGIIKEKDGLPCERWAARGHEHCYTHDPAFAEERKRACQRGARVTNAMRGHKLSATIPSELTSVGNLMKVVEYCIRETLAERMEPKISTAVVGLVRTQATLVMDHKMEDRINRLESALERDDEATVF